jgi:transmembrane sensor
VRRGKVRVYGPRGALDVAAGESHSFSVEEDAAEMPPEEAVGAAEDEEQPTPRVARRPRARRGSSEPGIGSWRSLHQSGDYDGAFALLETGAEVPDEASALMDAADAARLSGHARGSVTYLERVVRDHRDSPVAPLAAFTLGRVYLDRLGEPHRAAEAFGRARQLEPGGSLAQDALAREVEALSKAGDAQGAYRRAQEYLRAYPQGSRVRAVRLYGGIE